MPRALRACRSQGDVRRAVSLYRERGALLRREGETKAPRPGGLEELAAPVGNQGRPSARHAYGGQKRPCGKPSGSPCLMPSAAT